MIILKKIRTYYWLVQEFLKRHSKTVIYATIVAIVIIGSISVFSRFIPTPKATTRIARIGKFSPTTIPDDILRRVSKGLVSIDNTGIINAEIASSWKISDDGKTYIFTLDDTYRWHDGSTLVPEDISFNFKEVEQEYTENTITFRLSEPFAPFISILTDPLLKNERLGVGEFQITDIKSSGSILQAMTLTSRKEKIIYKFYPTENTALIAFSLGEVDVVENISYIPPELVTSKNVLITQSSGKNKIAALFFNNNDTILQAKSARQGIAYAIRNKSNGKSRALGPISNTSWAFNPNIKDYEFDEKRAVELFNQDIEKASDVTIEIKTMLQYLDVAESIAKDLEEVLGIQTTVKVTSSLTDNFQAVLVDYAPPTDPDQYTIWHSTQASNFTHYESLKVDKLLEDGRRTLDLSVRKDIYQDFQRFLLEDSPAVFLFYTSNYTVSRKSLFSSQ